MLTLITGGARSGKSARAQFLAESQPGELIYLATAQAFDEEMSDRIARHQADRGSRWSTVECPIDLPDAIARESGQDRVLLIDCLTLWTSNILLGEHDFEVASQRLIEILATVSSPVILVSNEVGMGIVPENALARRFRDMAGRLNQDVAAIVDHAELVVAGLCIPIKSNNSRLNLP